MNLGIDRNCFYANQITLENRDFHAAHIGGCIACSAKLSRLINQEKSIRQYFESFKIQDDVKKQLLQDLENVEKVLYPNLGRRLWAMVPVIRTNVSIFSKNLVAPRNLFLFAVSFIIYYFSLK